MSDLTRRIKKLKKLLQKDREKILFVTLIYADGSERKMESNEAFLALDSSVVDYRWDESNRQEDDNLIGAMLVDGPFGVRELFADGDDSSMLPSEKEG